MTICKHAQEALRSDRHRKSIQLAIEKRRIWQWHYECDECDEYVVSLLVEPSHLQDFLSAVWQGQDNETTPIKV